MNLLNATTVVISDRTKQLSFTYAVENGDTVADLQQLVEAAAALYGRHRLLVWVRGYWDDDEVIDAMQTERLVCGIGDGEYLKILVGEGLSQIYQYVPLIDNGNPLVSYSFKRDHGGTYEVRISVMMIL